MQPIRERRQQQTSDGSQNEFLDEEVAIDNNIEERNNQNLMFFDFECTQDDGHHIPNLCVVQKESGDETVFSGQNTKDEFCEWLFQSQNANTTLIAHNFQAYDGYFILQYLYKNDVTPEIIHYLWC